MSPILEKLQEMVQKQGIGGYFSAAALIIFFTIGFVSVWLAIGMLIYSLFSKNWSVWRKWKYIGYLALLGIGLLIAGVIIIAISGAI